MIRGSSISKGILVGGALTFGAFTLLSGLASSRPNGSATGEFLLGAILFIGATQILWMTPAAIYFALRGQWATVKGVLILAAIVFLLNAGCWGAVLSGESRYSKGFDFF